MEVLGEIKILVEELNRMAGTPDLARRIEIGDKLATYNWNLAELEAETHEDANNTEYEYKLSVSRHMMKGVGPATVRESAAKDKFSDLYKLTVQKQNLLKRLTLLRQQTNIVIEQNRQTVAALRSEYRQTHGQ